MILIFQPTTELPYSFGFNLKNRGDLLVECPQNQARTSSLIIQTRGYSFGIFFLNRRELLVTHSKNEYLDFPSTLLSSFFFSSPTFAEHL
jgi:hypothetical protein